MSSLFQLPVSLIFTILFFISTYTKIISSQTLVTCGNNTFYIQYPFQLLRKNHTKKSHKSSDLFNRKCNDQGLTVLSLPFSGDFYVRDIDYFNQKIILYDPDNCLPKRLMNMSLLSSPFMAIVYQSYTFFSCSKELAGSFNLTSIGCLSNSTASVMATSLNERADEIRKEKGCSVVASNLEIPVSSGDDEYENNGFVGDLQLKWSDPNCSNIGDGKGKSRSKSVLKIIIICFITVSLALLSTLFCIGCCLRFAGIILEANDGANINVPMISHILSTNTARETGQVASPTVQSQPEPLSFWDRSSWDRSGMILETSDGANIVPSVSQMSTSTARETGQVALHQVQSQPKSLSSWDGSSWDGSEMILETNDGANINVPTISQMSTNTARETGQVALPPVPPPPEPLSSRGGFSWDRSATEVLIISGRNCITGPNSDSCSICLEDYQVSERLRRICKCDHCFHEHCLDEWLQTKTTCPICRITV